MEWANRTRVDSTGSASSLDFPRSRDNGRKMHRKCASLAEAADTLDALRLLLPSVLAVFLPRPVTVTYARIVAGSAILRSELRRAAYAIEVVTEEDYLDRVRYAMSAADVILNGNHSALLAAAAYMHAAERLASIGNSPVEFAPEILLNLTKVLEVLFGNTRDRIRAGLTSLGYGEAEREGIFIPLVIMRNEIDVGHAKLTSLSPDVLDQLYSFLIDVPFSMKELIVRAVNATSLGTWQPPTPDPPGAPGDFGRLLASIEAGDRARTERVGKRLYLHFKRGISESADGGGSAVAVEPSR
jgi:hypothetical protein